MKKKVEGLGSTIGGLPRCTASRVCTRPGVRVAGSRLTPCLEHLTKKKERKYRNRPEWSDLANRRFDSGAERRYCEGLVALQKAGAISNLRFQVSVPLYGKDGSVVATWKADAVYEKDGKTVYCDVKGFITPEFRLKAKLFKASYGFEIDVVYPSKKK